MLGGWGTPDWRGGISVAFHFSKPPEAERKAVVTAPVVVTAIDAPVAAKVEEAIAVAVESNVDDDVRIEDARLVIPERIEFRRGFAFIDPASFQLLDRMAEVLIAHPEVKNVVIEGHADAWGPENINKWLSEQRARAVKDALIVRGVPATKLSTAAWSAEQPVGDDPRAASNRRVEIKLELE